MHKYRCELKENKKMLGILRSFVKKYPYLSSYEKDLTSFDKKVINMPANAMEIEKLELGGEIFKVACSMVECVWKNGNHDIIVDAEVYRYMTRAIFKLKNSDAWRDKKDQAVKFNREDKAALNAAIFFLLLVYDQEVNGNQFNSEVCVAYMFKRIIRVSCLGDLKPESKQWFKKNVPGYDDAMARHVLEEALKETNMNFISVIYSLADKITEREVQLFNIARAVANKIEFEHIKKNILHEDLLITEKQLEEEWEKYEVDKYVSQKLYSFFERLSYSRNMIRWQFYDYSVGCGILTHMFETAVIVWLMIFEGKGNFDELHETAANAFWIGLFHDLSELYTGDVSSLLKDGVKFHNGKTLRPYTEQQEVEVLEKSFYPCLHPKVAEYFREKISFESLTNAELYSYVKKADYLSADWELIFNLHRGCCEGKFIRIIKKSIKINRTPGSTKFLKKILNEIIFKKYFII